MKAVLPSFYINFEIESLTSPLEVPNSVWLPWSGELLSLLFLEEKWEFAEWETDFNHY